MGWGFHRRWMLVGAGVVSGLLACGRLAEVPDGDDARMSSQVVTLEMPNRATSGVLRSHDLRTGALTSTTLDDDTTGLEGAPVWSASGRWLMYLADVTRSPHLFVRRHDAQSTTKSWGEPVLANRGAFVSLAGGRVSPSPTRDHFLAWRDHGPTGTPVAVVSPRDDGTVAVREIHRLVGSARSDVVYQRINPIWTPAGDRIVMEIREASSPLRIVLFDVEQGDPDLPLLPSHELRVPDGLTFGEQGLGPISSDGVWMQSQVRSVVDGALDEVVISLIDGTPLGIPGCGRDERTGVACGFGPWHPSRAAAVITRGPMDARELALWSPSDGLLGSVPTVTPLSWVGTSHPRLLVKADRSRRLALVDFEGGAPVVTDVAGTDRETFKEATASPDGRWLLLEFSQGDTTWFEALDLDGDSNALPREVERRTEADRRYRFSTWGPSGSASVLLTAEYFKAGMDDLEDAIFIDLAASKSTLLEVSPVTPSAAVGSWSWANRISPDGKHVVVARDGKLAIWRKGSPTAEVVMLDDVSQSALTFWPPAAPPP